MGNKPAYLISPLAVSDLEEIWQYTVENWSAAQAEKYHSAIIAAFEGLASGRIAGRRADIREEYYKHLAGAHMIFFQRSDTGMKIIRILHQRMDAERHL